MRSRLSSDAIDASDVEPTRPDNALPEREPLRPWHVHLELRPEQLLALHRMGFTGGALAWREGMDDWQPLRVGDSGGSEPPPPESEPPAQLARVTAIDDARRRAQRESKPPPSPEERQRPARVTPFANARASVPPIAHAAPMPLVRLRRNADRPPPPVIPLPSFGADTMTALPAAPRALAASPVAFELKPASIPPIAVETSASSPRAGSSRAMFLGAAALVALAASNGALVAALLSGQRHEASSDEKLAAASAESRSAHPAPPLAAPPVSASKSATGGPGQPLSVEQLPLVGAARANREASSATSGEASASTSARSSSASGESTSRRGRRSSANVELSEERAARPTARAKPEATPTAPGAPDRRAMARAVGRAASAAASCSPGPEKGRVSLTFAPSGNVLGVSLLQGFGEAGTNACVLRAMGRARVNPFEGDAITVQKTLSW